MQSFFKVSEQLVSNMYMLNRLCGMTKNVVNSFMLVQHYLLILERFNAARTRNQHSRHSKNSHF